MCSSDLIDACVTALVASAKRAPDTLSRSTRFQNRGPARRCDAEAMHKDPPYVEYNGMASLNTSFLWTFSTTQRSDAKIPGNTPRFRVCTFAADAYRIRGMIGGFATSSPANEPAPIHGARWAITCTALAMGTVWVTADSSRTHGASVPTVHFVRWAAEPSTPTVGQVAPAIADPTQCVSPAAPSRYSTGAPDVTFETVRRATRTRWGGRYGP